MATGSGTLMSEKCDFDAFFKTEVELAKAKRLYHVLEKRLDQERGDFQERSTSLQNRIFDLEAQLHKEKIERLAKEEEGAARRKALEGEMKRQKAKYESRVVALEEDLRATKEAWAARLAEERKGWQGKVAEKVVLLQGEIDAARDEYGARIQALEAELAAALNARKRAQEELGLTKDLLQEEARRRRTLQAELDELKGKYQRCMDLAGELIALRRKAPSTSGASSSPDKGSSAAHAGHYHHHHHHGGLSFASSSSAATTTVPVAPRSSSRVPSSVNRLSTARLAPSENEILRKQLQLTQTLLDEELRKNHALRRDIARIASPSSSIF